jgi:hypothetical protein
LEILEKFVGSLSRAQGIRSVSEIGGVHASKLIDDLVARGAPLIEIEETYRALSDFFQTRGGGNLGALATRVRGLVEILDKGDTWLAIAGVRGIERVAQAGFRRHEHDALHHDCKACRSGISQGAWWTDEVVRVWHLPNTTMKPEARVRLHQAEASFRERSLLLSKATKGSKRYPVPEGQSYLPFQEAGIEYALMRRRALIGDEMGLGKTVEALGVVNALPSLRRILVVAPATLLLNWKREAQTWLVEKRPVEILAPYCQVPEGEGGVHHELQPAFHELGKCITDPIVGSLDRRRGPLPEEPIERSLASGLWQLAGTGSPRARGTRSLPDRDAAS